jgi:hypothetical protein
VTTTPVSLVVATASRSAIVVTARDFVATDASVRVKLGATSVLIACAASQTATVPCATLTSQFVARPSAFAKSRRDVSA